MCVEWYVALLCHLLVYKVQLTLLTKGKGLHDFLLIFLFFSLFKSVLLYIQINVNKVKSYC